MSEQNLSDRLADLPSKDLEWSDPKAFNLADDADQASLEAMLDAGQIETVTDPVTEIADGLYDLNHPDKKEDTEARAAYHDGIASQGETFGTWHYFPWSKGLVRYPDVQDHRDMRTFRNRNLVTDDEQAQLYDARMAVFGLSVGSSVVERLVSSGIGGTMIMADMDRLEPANLNRINGVFSDVGGLKLDRMAKFVSEVDPYIKQEHFPEGINDEGLDRLESLKPTIIFDEVDNIAMKAALRLYAKSTNTALVMASDVGDKSILDVERYDVDPNTAPFNGRIKEDDVKQLAAGNLSPEALEKAMMSIIGLRNATTRLIGSLLEKDKTLGGLPQLGNTATVGGAFAATAAREIVLGRDLPSGRYMVSPKNIMHLQSPSTLSDRIQVGRAFINRKRSK